METICTAFFLFQSNGNEASLVVFVFVGFSIETEFSHTQKTIISHLQNNKLSEWKQ